MKVLQVHGGMNIGGTETVIMNWYKNIDQNKIHFDFTTTFKTECPYDEFLKENGSGIKYIVPVSEGGYLKHCKSLYKVIKNGDYDVVHSHMNFHGGVVALISKLCGVKKIVCHAHSAPESLEIGTKNKILRFLINKFATNKLACNKGAGEYIYGVNSDFTVLKNAINIKPITEKSVDLISKYDLQSKKIIACIGRIDENKNQKFIVNLAKNLLADDIRFLFIGDGILRKNIEKYIGENDLTNRVICVGNQSNMDDWFSILDLVLMPSIYEGVPMAIIEAQSKGIPSLLSDTIKDDVDLGLGLVHFESLNDEKKWIDKIINIPNKLDDYNIIESTLTSHGYNIKQVVSDLEVIYGNK